MGRIEELLNCVNNKWDKRFHLEIHTRYSKRNVYFQRIKTMNDSGKPVSLHETPFESFEEYLKYLTRFDVGLVFYLPDYNNKYLGKNIEHIGLSSGNFLLT